MSTKSLASSYAQPGQTGSAIHWGLAALSVAGMAVFIWAALLYAKDSINLQGDERLAQRIFYLHMGCNFASLSAFMMSLIGSVVYLVKRDLDWDRVTQASVEVGLIFSIGTTVTGAIWAKPTWNTYWTWDPRLTSVTITLLIYAAYILFRNGIDNRLAKARIGSIYALVAFLSVPLTYYSSRWFRSIHPVVSNGQNADAQGSFDIGPSMGTTLSIAVISFCVLFSALMILRWRQLRLEDRISELREEID
jgi:heme exporter protein C